ncbi:MAG: bis(5'-nucleosyl)-tetraphosphatase (symmetrical) YqeK [Lachnospiraceae bacterium]|nr:bis(5'-nucleosyl)-tetraphosphatase (symmetrical) YqeK [Lachnospiraceae bacterium]
MNLYDKKEVYDLKLIKKNLSDHLKPSRYAHTIGVADTAAALAMKYGYDMNKAYVAGLLHDCAKYMTNDELLAYCNKNELSVTEGEKKAPHLLHSKAGAYMAKQDYHINDDEILHAILVHTTGQPNMNLLDKIIFVADYIEPNRDKAIRLEEIRQIAFWNLDFAILMILEDTISYIKDKNQFLDDSTLETFQFYLKEKNS